MLDRSSCKSTSSHPTSHKLTSIHRNSSETKMATTTETWETVASTYRSETTAKIPKDWLLPSSVTSSFSETSVQNVLDIPRTCGILTEEEIEITEKYDAITLARLLGEGIVKSVDVTRAFCKRAAIAQQLVS